MYMGVINTCLVNIMDDLLSGDDRHRTQGGLVGPHRWSICSHLMQVNVGQVARLKKQQH